jgi:hypothetical protein
MVPRRQRGRRGCSSCMRARSRTTSVRACPARAGTRLTRLTRASHPNLARSHAIPGQLSRVLRCPSRRAECRGAVLVTVDALRVARGRGQGLAGPCSSELGSSICHVSAGLTLCFRDRPSGRSCWTGSLKSSKPPPRPKSKASSHHLQTISYAGLERTSFPCWMPSYLFAFASRMPVRPSLRPSYIANTARRK